MTEAPPAILSMFVGDELEEVFTAIANDEYYVQNTLKKLKLFGDKESYIQSGDTSWAWNAFEFNRVEDASSDWGINNLKGHQIQVAFVLRSWNSTVGAAFTSVTIDAYDSTVAMLNKFANSNPEKDLCNSGIRGWCAAGIADDAVFRYPPVRIFRNVLRE